MSPDQGQSAREDKKQHIVNAAKAVLLKYGYGRVTMNDLAHAAGSSRPALDLVFSKKEDVFRAVVRQMARKVSDEANQGLGAVKSPLDKLKFVCELWMVRPFRLAESISRSQRGFRAVTSSLKTRSLKRCLYLKAI